MPLFFFLCKRLDSRENVHKVALCPSSTINPGLVNQDVGNCFSHALEDNRGQWPGNQLAERDLANETTSWTCPRSDPLKLITHITLLHLHLKNSPFCFEDFGAFFQLLVDEK